MIARYLQTFRCGAVGSHGELRVHGCKVEEDVGELEADVVLRNRTSVVVAQGWVPGEVASYLHGNTGVRSNAFIHSDGELTSTGNFPLIHTSCAAYACSFLIPLTCASSAWTAACRSLSISSKSCANMSGCWSYSVEIYCLIASDNDMLVVRLNGRLRIFLAEGQHDRNSV